MNFTLPATMTAAKPVEMTKLGGQVPGGFEMLLDTALQGQAASGETIELTGFTSLDEQDLISAEVQGGFALFPALFAEQTVLTSGNTVMTSGNTILTPGNGILGESLNVGAASNNGQAIATVASLGPQAVATPIAVSPPLIGGSFDGALAGEGTPEKMSTGSGLQTASTTGVQAVMAQTVQASSSPLVPGIKTAQTDIVAPVPTALVHNPTQTLTPEITPDTATPKVWAPFPASGQVISGLPSEISSLSGVQNNSGVAAVVAPQTLQAIEPKGKGLLASRPVAEQTKLGIPLVTPKIGSTQPTVTDPEATTAKPVKGQFNTSDTNSFLNSLSQGGKAIAEVSSLMPAVETRELPRPVEPGASLLPDQVSQIKASGPLEEAIKPQPKPFAQALVAQVKAVDVKEGRTSVSLHPRGLGQIEIDIVTDKDSSLRVVVRVENPMVLQTLRDERQMLATAMGLTDAGSFDFEQGFSGDSNQGKHGQSAQAHGDDVGFAGASSGIRHEDVVADNQLNILT